MIVLQCYLPTIIIAHSQKVLRDCLFGWYDSTLMCGGLKLDEFLVKLIIKD